MKKQALPAGTELKIFLLDDGSKDGTAEAVEAEFPEVVLLFGDGNLYYWPALRIAWAKAKEEDFDAYLWLNNDVVLDDNALFRVIQWSEKLGPGCVVGGAVRDSEKGTVIYSGNVRYDYHPMHFKRLNPDASDPIAVDYLNGNIVLIPRAVSQKLDNIAPYIKQGGGDTEFGLRVVRSGFKNMLLPGTYGTCPSNPPGVLLRGVKGYKAITHIKDHPPSAFIPFCREYCGPFWFIYLGVMYAKAFVVGYRPHV